MTAKGRDWLDKLPVVRLELQPQAHLSRIFVNGEEWSAAVKRVSVDVTSGLTIVDLAFYAKVTAEGPLNLQPWPILVENVEPKP